MSTPLPSAAVLPAQTRLARFQPATFKEDARTVEVVWSTGADVPRFDPWENKRYIERLNMSPEAVNLSRLNNGAPLLNSHAAYRLENVLGRVESAVIDSGEGRATIRFSARDEVAAILADVRDGILCNISVGYSVDEIRVTQNRDGPDLWEVVRWTPFELSLVAIPADAGAQVRQENRNFPVIFIRASDDAATQEQTMTTTQAAVDPAANTTANTPHPELVEGRSGAQTSTPFSKDYAAQIRTAAFACGLTIEDAMDVMTETRSLTEARAALVARAEAKQLANQGGRPIGSPVAQLVADHTDPAQVRSAMATALATRANPDLGDAARRDAASLGHARKYMTMGFAQIFADLARSHGEGTLDPSNKGEFAQALQAGLFSRAGFAHTTSDFSNILSSAQNKILLQVYPTLPKSYTVWAQRVEFNDWKDHNFLRMGDFPSAIGRAPGEGGGTQYGTMGEKLEVIRPVNYLPGMSLTQEVLVNDDLGAFNQLGAAIASRAATDENTLVYNVLLGAPAFTDGDGPTLREGSARMFTTGRGNKASTGTAITLAALQLARGAIRKQTGLNNQPLNLDANIIICGVDKELEANQLTVPLTPAQATNANPYSSRLTVVSDVNVTGNGWYLGCAPAMSPVVYGYVRGLNGPIISTEVDFDTKGLKLQLQMAFGAGARDFRGMYRNPGA
jgi:hypothetical protein